MLTRDAFAVANLLVPFILLYLYYVLIYVTYLLSCIVTLSAL